MSARLIEKNEAIKLRKSGFSYADIQKKINVSRSLLSYWFKNLKLSESELALIRSKITSNREIGINKSSITNRNKRKEREKVDYEMASNIFEKYRNEVGFLIGISLYWAEGAKKHSAFQFVNSDPDMVLFMFNWMQKYLKLDIGKIKCRIFVHPVPGYENIENFWANLLGINASSFQKTIFKPTNLTFKRNPEYKGCVRLSISDVRLFRIVRAWQKLLIQYYGNMRS